MFVCGNRGVCETLYKGKTKSEQEQRALMWFVANDSACDCESPDTFKELVGPNHTVGWPIKTDG